MVSQSTWAKWELSWPVWMQNQSFSLFSAGSSSPGPTAERCSWILTAVKFTEKFPVSPSKECIPRKPITATKTQRNSLKTSSYSSYSLLLFLAYWLPPTTVLSFLPPLQASNPSLYNHFPLDWVLHNPAESAALLTGRKQLLALLHHIVAAPAQGQESLNFLALSCLPCCDLLTLKRISYQKQSELNPTNFIIFRE